MGRMILWAHQLRMLALAERCLQGLAGISPLSAQTLCSTLSSFLHMDFPHPALSAFLSYPLLIRHLIPRLKLRHLKMCDSSNPRSFLSVTWVIIQTCFFILFQSQYTPVVLKKCLENSMTCLWLCNLLLSSLFLGLNVYPKIHYHSALEGDRGWGRWVQFFFITLTFWKLWLQESVL